LAGGTTTIPGRITSTAHSRLNVEFLPRSTSIAVAPQPRSFASPYPASRMYVLSITTVALLLAPLASGAPQSAAAGGKPVLAELPRVTVSTTYPTGGRAVRVGANANLQAAFDAARPGDVLLLPPGATYVGNFRLRDKGAGNAPAGGWIVVRTDVSDAALGAAGTRMTPSRAASLKLARILSPNYDPAIGTDAAAHHWRFTGVEISATPTTKLMNMLLRLGESGDQQRTLAQMPHHLIVDRSFVHGTPTLEVRRCITLNGGTTAVVDSWFADCHSNAGDSQAVVTYNGTGPFKIQNNHLEAGHEVVMFGGADPSIRGLVPSDIEVRGNHITRPLAWKKKWQVKNLIETKNVQRLLIEGNVLDNNWSDAQGGFAFVLKSENQSGFAPWTTASDITIRDNYVKGTGSGFNMSATGSNGTKSVPAARFLITNNLVEAVNTGPFTGEGIAFQILGALSDIVITHNTIINQKADASTVVFDGAPTRRLVMHSNIFGGGRYGVHGSNAGSGVGTLARYAPGGTFQRNVVVGANCGAYPSGTACPDRMTSAGFVSAIKGDFRAGAGALKGRGLDGGDIGADIDRVEAATRGAIVAP
jgi:hypothetical protein